MANPTMPDLTEAQAEALSAVLDTGTGIKHQTFEADETSTPSAFAQLMNLERKLMLLLAGACKGMAISLSSGLNIGVYALTYMIGTTQYSYAGDATFALTASSTNYLYLDSSATLKNSTTGWPAGDHYKIARITTDASAVTGVTDCRAMNYAIGIINTWYNVAAAGDVDFNGQGISDLAALALSDSTELTIAGGSITPTQILHTVDTEGDAATDDLTDITADAAAGQRRLLLLRVADAARVVTIKSTGNITLLDGDFILDDLDKCILLIQASTTTWLEIGRNFNTLATLQADLDANSKNITNIGTLNLQIGAKNISAGAVTMTESWFMVSPEGGTGPDDLDTINGGVQGDLIFLTHDTGGNTITVKHDTGNINLTGSADYVMSDWTYSLLLHNLGGTWYEIGRSHLKLSDLVNTGQVIPYPLSAHYPGTLTVNQATFNFLAPVPLKLTQARGYVVGAPSGGSCVVHILKNGASVFTADTNAINIQDGTDNDASDVIDVDFAAGDRLTVKVTSVNGATDLTVSIDAYVQAKQPTT